MKNVLKTLKNFVKKLLIMENLLEILENFVKK